MANKYSAELAPARSGSLPQQFPDSALVGSKVRCTRATITLTADAIGDTWTICELPTGARLKSIVIDSSVSLGATTLAIGIAGTPAKYQAAGTFTAVNTPTPVNLTAVIKTQAPLAAPETIIVTLAAAAAPASGTIVFEVEFHSRA